MHMSSRKATTINLCFWRIHVKRASRSMATARVRTVDRTINQHQPQGKKHWTGCSGCSGSRSDPGHLASQGCTLMESTFLRPSRMCLASCVMQVCWIMCFDPWSIMRVWARKELEAWTGGHCSLDLIWSSQFPLSLPLLSACCTLHYTCRFHHCKIVCWLFDFAGFVDWLFSLHADGFNGFLKLLI